MALGKTSDGQTQHVPTQHNTQHVIIGSKIFQDFTSIIYSRYSTGCTPTYLHYDNGCVIEQRTAWKGENVLLHYIDTVGRF